MSSLPDVWSDVVQYIKRVILSDLTIFVVAHQSPAIVRRQHLGRQEMLSCERTLARPTWADEDDERKFWDFDLHEISLIPSLQTIQHIAL